MKIKTLIAACAVLAATVGATVAPAEAQPYHHGHRHHRDYDHHRGYHHHRDYHQHYRHHRRHGGIVGNVVRGVARGL